MPTHEDDPSRRGAPSPESAPQQFPEPRAEEPPPTPEPAPVGGLPRHPPEPPPGLPRFPGEPPAGPGGPPPAPPPGFAGPWPPAAGPPAQAVASYGARVAGYLVDAVILAVVAAVLLAITRGARLRRAAHPHLHAVRPGVGLVVLAVIGLVYGGLFCGSRGGQTPGMMVAKVRCVDAATGAPIGMARGLGRALVAQVLGLLFVVPLVVDLLWPAWDPRRQTLHDKAVGSVVVRA